MKNDTAVRPSVVGRLFFYLWVVLFPGLLPNAAFALELSEAQLSRLSGHPTWLRLLHVPVNTRVVANSHSEVNSPEFFVSENRHASARDELSATVNALNLLPGTSTSSAALATNTVHDGSHSSEALDVNESVRCRFPARAYWLSRELNQPHWQDFSECTRLKDWAKLDTLKSVSLIMISGYFGNPASTFGHSLLRLNNSAFDEQSPLLDLGINFGAQVPPGEATAVYILRGLFGGYQSGFSDRTFYEHDQTYNRVEFRDRWEYTLNLNEHQRKLMVLHLWEITGKKFTYYFIHQNCSYRLAELLELSTDNEITEDVSMWYAPVSLFHDTRRLTLPNGEPLFTDVSYVPSIEQQLRQRMADLDGVEEKELMHVISGNESSSLNDLSIESQTRVLSTALDYFEYKLTSLGEPEELSESEPTAQGDVQDDADSINRRAIEALKQAAIRKRLSLPASTPNDVPVKNRTAPSALDPPSVLNMGYGHKENLGGFFNLNYAAYQQKAIGRNTYQQSALVAFDLTLAVHDDLGVFVDNLDFVRARKTNAPGYYLPGENRRSWDVGIGLETTRRDCFRCLETFVEGSVGRSKRYGDRWLFDAAIGGRLSSKDSAIELIPKARLIYSPHENWSTEVEAAWWSSPTRGSSDSQMRYQLDLRYSFGNNLQVTASLDHFYQFQGNVNFGWRW